MIGVLLGILLPYYLNAQNYYPDRISVYIENNTGPVHLNKASGSFATGLPGFDQMLAKYQVQAMKKRLPSASSLDHDGNIYLDRFYEIQLPRPVQDLDGVIQDFASQSGVKMVERIPINRIDYTPNDPMYNLQWALPQIRADRAWDLWENAGDVPGDSSIVVGIVDTGVQWDHPDLIDNLWQNLGEDADGDGMTIEYVDGAWQLDSGDIDNIDTDGDGYIDDLIGWDPAGTTSAGDADNNPMGIANIGVNGANMHGTHVSGIVAATADNNRGIAGIGYSVRFMPVKCTYDEDPESYVSSGYDGITYAAKAGADVINLSWGSYGSSGFAQSVINTAHNQYGAIIVAAAGNEATTQTHYPSGYDNVISVTATGVGDVFNGWATRGPTVDISAPGEGIRSTVYTNHGSYQSWDGTSMASPVVSGSVALFWSMFPDSSQSYIEQRIVSAADNIDDINPDYAGEIGAGRVNVFKAIASRWLPKLTYLSHSVILVNDDDGILNPGETAKLRVVIQNETDWATATHVTGLLSSSSPDVTISDSEAVYNDIQDGNAGVNITDTFEFTLASDIGLGAIPFTLTVTGGEAPYTFETTLHFEVNVRLFQAGFPYDIGATINTSPLIYDIDGDNSNEIITGSDNYNLYVLNADGTAKTGFPFSTQNQIRGSAAVGDVDNDGDTEIVIASKDKYIYIINPDGSLQQKIETGGYLMSTPALVDLDGDGDLEIIATSFDRNVYVLNHDSTAFGNFPVSLNEPLMTAPAVADIDNNGSLDIVVGTWSNHLFAINTDGETLDGFPFSAGARFDCNPAIFDMDGDDSLEIAIGSDDNHLYVVDHTGEAVIDYTANSYVRSTPNFYDVNGDGTMEIFFGSISQRLYGINAQGEGLAGFPIEVDGGIYGNPIFADMEGDGEPELLVGTSGGSVGIYNLDGSPYNDFPINIHSAINSALAVGYLDDDNDFEIVYGTTHSLEALDIKSVGQLQGYNHIDRGDPQRTGYYGGSGAVGTVREQTLPNMIVLSENYPNPFNPTTQIRYSLPKAGHVSLTIFDLKGNVVKTLINKVQVANRYTVEWDGTNNRGSQVASGIYLYRLTTSEKVITKKMTLIR